MNLEFIEATTLPDAWFQTMFKILDRGSLFTVDAGSYSGHKRLEFFYITIDIKHPSIKPLLPQIPNQYNIDNPVPDDYLDRYLPYLMTGHLQPNESYTYGQRLVRYPIPNTYILSNNQIFIDEIEELKKLGIIFYDEEFKCLCLNQIELLIWTYKNKGFRNNQMTLQIAHPSDMVLKDPPCMRTLDTRIEGGKFHIFPYFRSWDLYSGFPANLGGIQLLKEYIVGQIGLGDGKIIVSSKGLHLYDYVFDIAKILRMKTGMELKDGVM